LVIIGYSTLLVSQTKAGLPPVGVGFGIVRINSLSLG